MILMSNYKKISKINYQNKYQKINYQQREGDGGRRGRRAASSDHRLDME